MTDEELEKMNVRNKLEAQRYLTELASKLKHDVSNLKTEVLEGKAVVETLAEYAEKNNVDLILIATQ